MRTATLTRAATAAALAAAAGLALAGTASAATPAPAAAKTALKVVEAKDVITGKLTEGKTDLAKKTVDLWTVAGKKTTLVTKGTTNKDGVVTFKIKPSATSVYELSFAGGKGLAAAHSTDVTVKVTAKK
jgi:5-hydroxyisourate hydrolase-like protein (transthyretin family)